MTQIYSIRQLIAGLQDLLDDGHKTLTDEELVRVIRPQKTVEFHINNEEEK